MYCTYSGAVHVGPEEDRSNPKKHGVSFIEAASVFADPLAAMMEDALDPSEGGQAATTSAMPHVAPIPSATASRPRIQILIT